MRRPYLRDTTAMSLRALLLPDTPRRLPYGRFISVTSRTAHIAAIGVLLGGHVFGIAPDHLLPWLWGAIVSGAILLLPEVYTSLDWFAQGGGVAFLVKLAVLCTVPLAWDARVPILFVVLAIASVGSHMPGRFRHYSFRFRRNMKGVS